MTSLLFKDYYINKYNFGALGVFCLFFFFSLINSISSLLSQNAISYLSVDLKMKWCLKCICVLFWLLAGKMAYVKMPVSFWTRKLFPSLFTFIDKKRKVLEQVSSVLPVPNKTVWWHFSIYRFVTLSLLVKDQLPLWWYLKNLISLNVSDTESFSSGSCKSVTFSSPKFSVKFSQRDFFLVLLKWKQLFSFLWSKM